MKNKVAKFSRQWISVFTLVCFISTGQSSGLLAQVSSSPANTLEAKPIDLSQFKLDEAIGTFEKFDAKNPNAKRPVVFVIQDAHAVTDAQRNIEKIISELHHAYGISFVGLEGAKSHLDSTLLKTFPDEIRRQKILSQYFERGELAGPQLSAISGLAIKYESIEQWELFREHYQTYLSAVNQKTMALKWIESESLNWDKKRKEALTSEANVFIEKHQAFLRDQMDFSEFIRVMGEYRSDLPVAEYPELNKLMDFFAKAAQMSAADSEVKVIADNFKSQHFSKLNVDSQKRWNAQYQDFVSSRISSEQMLEYISQAAEVENAQLNLSPKLESMLRGHRQFLGLKGPKLFSEMQRAAEQIENRFADTDEKQEILSQLRSLWLLEKLAKLQCTHFEYQSEKQSGYLNRFLKLQNQKIFDPAFQFYALATKRDKAIYEKFSRLTKEQSLNGAMLVLGGFHTEGLKSLLREAGYSLAVITPKMNSIKGSENYERLMAGELSYKASIRSTFYDGFMVDVISKLLAQYSDVERKRILKSWRDEVIRDLVTRKQIERAREYTAYLDLAAKVSDDEKEKIVANLRTEFSKIKAEKMKEIKGRFEKQFSFFKAGLTDLITRKALNVDSARDLIQRSEKVAAIQTPAGFALDPQISSQEMFVFSRNEVRTEGDVVEKLRGRGQPSPYSDNYVLNALSAHTKELTGKSLRQVATITGLPNSRVVKYWRDYPETIETFGITPKENKVSDLAEADQNRHRQQAQAMKRFVDTLKIPYTEWGMILSPGDPIKNYWVHRILNGATLQFPEAYRLTMEIMPKPNSQKQREAFLAIRAQYRRLVRSEVANDELADVQFAKELGLDPKVISLWIKYGLNVPEKYMSRARQLILSKIKPVSGQITQREVLAFLWDKTIDDGSRKFIDERAEAVQKVLRIVRPIFYKFNIFNQNEIEAQTLSLLATKLEYFRSSNIKTETLNGLIYRAVRNAFYDQHRRDARHQHVRLGSRSDDGDDDSVLDDNVLEDHSPDASLSTIARESGILVDYWVTQLPPVHFQVISREMNGMTYDQIAADLDIPVGTVKSRIHAAKKILAIHLGEPQDEHGSISLLRSTKNEFTDLDVEVLHFLENLSVLDRLLMELYMEGKTAEELMNYLAEPRDVVEAQIKYVVEPITTNKPLIEKIKAIREKSKSAAGRSEARMISSYELREKFGDKFTDDALVLNPEKTVITNKKGERIAERMPWSRYIFRPYRDNSTALNLSKVIKVVYYYSEIDDFMPELDRIQRLQMANVSGVSHISRIGMLSTGGIWVELDGIENGRSLESEIFGSIPRFFDVMTRAAEIFRDIHAMGIIHGDIKPANIIVNGNQVEVIDFGLGYTHGFNPSDDKGGEIEETRGADSDAFSFILTVVTLLDNLLKTEFDGPRSKKVLQQTRNELLRLIYEKPAASEDFPEFHLTFAKPTKFGFVQRPRNEWPKDMTPVIEALLEAKKNYLNADAVGARQESRTKEFKLEASRIFMDNPKLENRIAQFPLKDGFRQLKYQDVFKGDGVDGQIAGFERYLELGMIGSGSTQRVYLSALPFFQGKVIKRQSTNLNAKGSLIARSRYDGDHEPINRLLEQVIPSDVIEYPLGIMAGDEIAEINNITVQRQMMMLRSLWRVARNQDLRMLINPDPKTPKDFRDWFNRILKQSNRSGQEIVSKVIEGLGAQAADVNTTQLWRAGLFNADPSEGDLGIIIENGKPRLVLADFSHVFVLPKNDEDIESFLSQEDNKTYLTKAQQFWMATLKKIYDEGDAEKAQPFYLAPRLRSLLLPDEDVVDELLMLRETTKKKMQDGGQEAAREYLDQNKIFQALTKWLTAEIIRNRKNPEASLVPAPIKKAVRQEVRSDKSPSGRKKTDVNRRQASLLILGSIVGLGLMIFGIFRKWFSTNKKNLQKPIEETETPIDYYTFKNGMQIGDGWKIFSGQDDGPGGNLMSLGEGNDATELQVRFKNKKTLQYDQIFALRGSSYARAVPYDEFGLPTEWGTSVIPVFSQWVGDQYFHNPKITSVTIAHNKKNDSIYLTASVADPAGYFDDSTIHFEIFPPGEKGSVIKVDYRLRAKKEFNVSRERQLKHEGFKLATLATMNIGVDHDADTAIASTTSRKVTRRNLFKPGQLYFERPEALGDDGVLIAANIKPSEPRSERPRPSAFLKMLQVTWNDKEVPFSLLYPQGFNTPSQDPDDDSASIWINFDSLRGFSVGDELSVEYYFGYASYGEIDPKKVLEMIDQSTKRSAPRSELRESFTEVGFDPLPKADDLEVKSQALFDQMIKGTVLEEFVERAQILERSDLANNLWVEFVLKNGEISLLHLTKNGENVFLEHGQGIQAVGIPDISIVFLLVVMGWLNGHAEFKDFITKAKKNGRADFFKLLDQRVGQPQESDSVIINLRNFDINPARVLGRGALNFQEVASRDFPQKILEEFAVYMDLPSDLISPEFREEFLKWVEHVQKYHNNDQFLIRFYIQPSLKWLKTTVEQTDDYLSIELLKDAVHIYWPSLEDEESQRSVTDLFEREAYPTRFERLQKYLGLWEGENANKFGEVKELMLNRYQNVPGVRNLALRLGAYLGTSNQATFNEAAAEVMIAYRLEQLFEQDYDVEMIGLGLDLGSREYDILINLNLKPGVTPRADMLEPGVYLVEAKEDNTAPLKGVIQMALLSQVPKQVENADLLRLAGLPVKGIIVAAGGKKSSQDRSQPVGVIRRIPQNEIQDYGKGQTKGAPSRIPVYSAVVPSLDVQHGPALSNREVPAPTQKQLQDWASQKLKIGDLFGDFFNPEFGIWSEKVARAERKQRGLALKALQQREHERIRMTIKRMQEKKQKNIERAKDLEKRENESAGWAAFLKQNVEEVTADEINRVVDWYFIDRNHMPLEKLRNELQSHMGIDSGYEDRAAKASEVWSWLKNLYDGKKGIVIRRPAQTPKAPKKIINIEDRIKRTLTTPTGWLAAFQKTEARQALVDVSDEEIERKISAYFELSRAFSDLGNQHKAFSLLDHRLRNSMHSPLSDKRTLGWQAAWDAVLKTLAAGASGLGIIESADNDQLQESSRAEVRTATFDQREFIPWSELEAPQSNIPKLSDENTFFFSNGSTLRLGNVVLSWPFKGGIFGGKKVTDLLPREFYVLSAQNGIADHGSALNLTPEQTAYIKRRFLKKEDRYLAYYHPRPLRELTNNAPIKYKISPDEWAAFYSGKTNPSALENNRQMHPIVVERVLRAIRHMKQSGRKDFRILQDGVADGLLLLKVRERLRQEFPDDVFKFYGVDLNWNAIQAELPQKTIVPDDVVIKNGSADDVRVFGDEVSENYFDLVIDYGLTIKSIIPPDVAGRIFEKWSSWLKPGGVIFSVPYEEQGPWLYALDIPENLTVVSRSIPELIFKGLRPRIFMTLQKSGGDQVGIPPIKAQTLFAGIDDEVESARSESRVSLTEDQISPETFLFSSLERGKRSQPLPLLEGGAMVIERESRNYTDRIPNYKVYIADEKGEYTKGALEVAFDPEQGAIYQFIHLLPAGDTHQIPLNVFNYIAMDLKSRDKLFTLSHVINPKMVTLLSKVATDLETSQIFGLASTWSWESERVAANASTILNGHDERDLQLHSKTGNLLRDPLKISRNSQGEIALSQTQFYKGEKDEVNLFLQGNVVHMTRKNFLNDDAYRGEFIRYWIHLDERSEGFPFMADHLNVDPLRGYRDFEVVQALLPFGLKISRTFRVVSENGELWLKKSPRDEMKVKELILEFANKRDSREKDAKQRIYFDERGFLRIESLTPQEQAYPMQIDNSDIPWPSYRGVPAPIKTRAEVRADLNWQWPADEFEAWRKQVGEPRDFGTPLDQVLKSAGIDPNAFTAIYYPASGNGDDDLLAKLTKTFSKLKEFFINNFEFKIIPDHGKSVEVNLRKQLNKINGDGDSAIINLDENDYINETPEWQPRRTSGKAIWLHKWAGENDSLGADPLFQILTLKRGYVQTEDLVIVRRTPKNRDNIFQWDRLIAEEVRIPGFPPGHGKSFPYAVYTVTEKDLENAEKISGQLNLENSLTAPTISQMVTAQQIMDGPHSVTDEIKQRAEMRITLVEKSWGKVFDAIILGVQKGELVDWSQKGYWQTLVGEGLGVAVNHPNISLGIETVLPVLIRVGVLQNTRQDESSQSLNLNLTDEMKRLLDHPQVLRQALIELGRSDISQTIGKAAYLLDAKLMKEGLKFEGVTENARLAFIYDAELDGETKLAKKLVADIDQTTAIAYRENRLPNRSVVERSLGKDYLVMANGDAVFSKNIPAGNMIYTSPELIYQAIPIVGGWKPLLHLAELLKASQDPQSQQSIILDEKSLSSLMGLLQSLVQTAAARQAFSQSA